MQTTLCTGRKNVAEGGPRMAMEVTGGDASGAES